jgi:hypothetical protein
VAKGVSDTADCGSKLCDPLLNLGYNLTAIIGEAAIVPVIV